MANDEHWLPVVGFEGAYEVSDKGRVRSLDRMTVGPTGRRCAYPGRILAGVINAGGYRVYDLAGAKMYGHTLTLEAFIGPRPEAHQACHGDGNPSNNVLENLRWDNISGNRKDTVKHGRHRGALATHCPWGHPYSGANCGPQAKGRVGRRCVSCSRAHSRVRYRPEMREHFQQVADGYYARIREEETVGKPK